MKIRSVKLNNRKKAFEITTSARTFQFPYSKAVPRPSTSDPIIEVSIDKELGSEGITYVLRSGCEGSVHIEQVLDYNQDPAYLRDSVVYKLTLEARRRIEASPLSKREIIRRLGTSATQLYRLLDQSNYRKSIDQLLSLLGVLDCQVDVKVRPRRLASRAA